MRIELERKNGRRLVPVPYIKDTNEINLHMMDYAIYREKYPKFIHKTHRKAQPKTISDSLDRIAFLINTLDEQEYTDNTTGRNGVGVHYLHANYKDNMEPIIEALRTGHGDPESAWKESSIEQYVKAWRSFYRFLSASGVDHAMDMPDTIERESRQEQDTNFQSHTNTSEYGYDGEIETAIEQNNKEWKEDYYDDVISMEMFWDLYTFLHDLDPVYAVMAFCQITSLLRVSALVRDFPIAPTRLNPKFLTYPVVERRSDLAKQEIAYKAKGGKTKTTYLPRQVHKILHTEYIAPDIEKESSIEGTDIPSMTYQKRYALFKSDYCTTEWATKKDVSTTMKPTWLLRNGTPVCNRKYQKAFEKASEALGFHVHNHMMRHTGATQFLWRYLKINNLTASHTNHLLVSDAHLMLQKLLGHRDVETTRKYVKTIERMQLEGQMNEILNYSFSKSKKHHQELLKINPAIGSSLSAMQEASKSFDEFMTAASFIS